MATLHRSVAVFVSGRGSNMQALWRASQQPNARYAIGCVVADELCPALEFAVAQGIPCHILAPDDRIIARKNGLKKLEQDVLTKIDIIALAGFMRLIRADFLHDWHRQKKLIVNIHPSLLPRYPGLNTHARAIAAGDQQAGCSVHHVDSGMDTGVIIAQASCPIAADDTPESLAQRVLSLEHDLYPHCLNALCKGQNSC